MRWCSVRCGGGGNGGLVGTVKIGARREIVESVVVEFTSSWGGILGDRRDIMFWVDRWIDNQRLCDRFPRLYHLDMRKESNVREKKRQRLRKDEKFTVKGLSRLVEEKILHVDSVGQGTLCNKLVPKKVNIFVWRALKGRLLVRVELDRRGIDLDSVLCPSCNNSVETCAHCLTTCGLALSVWEKIFNWWKVGDVNVFSIDVFFSSNVNVNVPTLLSRVWQAISFGKKGMYVCLAKRFRVQIKSFKISN
ncbi:RNA-directed DNA polymerase, eukaryota, reverse transcriptase zinc-binding domain protein [Tanacetum coccineum]